MEEVVDTRRLDLTAAHPLGRVHRVDSALTRCLHRAVMGEMLMGNINDGYLATARRFRVSQEEVFA